MYVNNPAGKVAQRQDKTVTVYHCIGYSVCTTGTRSTCAAVLRDLCFGTFTTGTHIQWYLLRVLWYNYVVNVPKYHQVSGYQNVAQEGTVVLQNL